ncbi:putative Cell division protein [Alphaproteobacteria bacterium]
MYNLRKIVVLTATTTLLCYFVYHVINGRRGLLALLEIDQQLIEREKAVCLLMREREELQNKVKSLKAGSYDSDFVDELSRHYFGLAESDEKVVIVREPQQKNSQY